MVGAAMAGCSSTGNPLSTGSNPNGGNGGFPPQVGTALIRVINGSPDYLTPTGGGIDIYIDGTRVWQNMPYGNFNGKAGGVATSPYYVTSIAQVALAPSAHSIQVYPAGAAAGNGSLLASTTTLPGPYRTTVVVADKVFGAIPLALQAIPFLEPVLSAPSGFSDNVVIHHAAPNGAPGVLSTGTLAVHQNSGGVQIVPTCTGNLVFSNPPANLSQKVYKLVNNGNSPIGYYVANPGTVACHQPIAEFFPGTAATAPPIPPSSPPPSLNGFPNSGIVYPTPIPSAAGRPVPLPFDCDSTLPPTCNGVPPNPSATPPNPLVTSPNLSLYAIDAPPVPPATVPGVLILGVFDTNQQ
jgi:Domain of unknown function (DUF4397)